MANPSPNLSIILNINIFSSATETYRLDRQMLRQKKIHLKYAAYKKKIISPIKIQRGS